MPKIIAEINEKIISEKGNKILLNEDKKFYLHNGINYKELSLEHIEKLDEKECLVWIDEGTRKAVLNFIEQNRNIKTNTPVVHNNDNIYNQDNIDHFVKKKKKRITIVLSVLNFLLLVSIILIVVFRPTDTIEKIKIEETYYKKIYENVGEYVVPISTEHNTMITSRNNKTEVGDTSAIYNENIIISNLGGDVPLSLGPLDFQKENFAQTEPTFNGNIVAFTDNRINKSYWNLYFMSLDTYKIYNIINPEIEEQAIYNTDTYTISQDYIFYNQIFNQDTDQEKTILSCISTNGILKGSYQELKIDEASMIKDIIATDKWLSYKKDGVEMLKEYYLLDTENTFNTKKDINLTALIGSEELDVIDIKDQNLLYSVGTEFFITDLNILSSETTESAVIESIESTGGISYDTSLQPVLLKDYSNNYFVVYYFEQTLYSYDLQNKITTEIKNNIDKIMDIKTFKSRIYWIESRTDKGTTINDMFVGTVPITQEEKIKE